MNFTFEDLNDELFGMVIAFSSIGSGLGSPGSIYMLTNDGKDYYIGQEGFEGDWIHLRNIFHFMYEAFSFTDNWVSKHVQKEVH